MCVYLVLACTLSIVGRLALTALEVGSIDLVLLAKLAILIRVPDSGSFPRLYQVRTCAATSVYVFEYSPPMIELPRASGERERGREQAGS